MLGAESQFNNNSSNHVHSSQNSQNVSTKLTAQVSCTTTTLIKYRLNNCDSSANNTTTHGESRHTDTSLGHHGPPRDGVVHNGLGASTGCNCATTKSTTTTTFSVSHNNPQSERHQCRNMQQSTESEKLTRPPFVTTVTRGKFLPSKFDLLVEKSLFTFSSRPRPVNLIKKHCCASTPSPAPTTTAAPTPFSKSSSRNSTLGAANRNEGSLAASRTSTTTPPRGAHDYYNVMWDPHVIRGTTASTTRVGEQPKEVKQTAASETSTEPKLSKVKRTATTTAAQKPVVRSRYFKPFPNSFLPSSSSPATTGRLSTMIQTEGLLEELPASDRVLIHQSIQTEPIREGSSNSSRKKVSKAEAQVQVKYGVDNSTQILPGELFCFDDEVQPVLESLIGKILEQAMFETVEEEEIAALREEKNRFHEQRRKEEKELLELQKEHERINAEKEQLQRRLEDDRNNLSADSWNYTNSRQSRASSSNMSSEFFKREVTDSIQRVSGGTTVYTTSYLLELLPSVLNSLRQEGFLNDNIDEDIFSRSTSIQRPDSVSPPMGRQDSQERVIDITATNETQEEITSCCKNDDIETNQPVISTSNQPIEDDRNKWEQEEQRCDSEATEKELEDLSTSSPPVSWSTDATRRQESQLSHNTSTTTTTTVTMIVNQLSSSAAATLDEDT